MTTFIDQLGAYIAHASDIYSAVWLPVATPVVEAVGLNGIWLVTPIIHTVLFLVFSLTLAGMASWLFSRNPNQELAETLFQSVAVAPCLLLTCLTSKYNSHKRSDQADQILAALFMIWAIVAVLIYADYIFLQLAAVRLGIA